MISRQLGAILVEAELLAGKFEPPADHPGDRAAAGHPFTPVRIVIPAATRLTNELEHVAITIGKIRDQPFAEQIAHFQGKA